MMVHETTLTLNNRVGLHARPAALFVQQANRYKCTIRVSRAGGEPANGKSILGILSLSAGQGATITIRAQGEDAAEAIATLQALCDDNFGEEE